MEVEGDRCAGEGDVHVFRCGHNVPFDLQDVYSGRNDIYGNFNVREWCTERDGGSLRYCSDNLEVSDLVHLLDLEDKAEVRISVETVVVLCRTILYSPERSENERDGDSTESIRQKVVIGNIVV